MAVACVAVPIVGLLYFSPLRHFPGAMKLQAGFSALDREVVLCSTLFQHGRPFAIK
jgi:hypothetical protein